MIGCLRSLSLFRRFLDNTISRAADDMLDLPWVSVSCRVSHLTNGYNLV